MRNGFTIIEVVIVFLLILGVTFFILPRSLDNTRQAKFISEWTEKYSELDYTFSVIRAQKDGDIREEFTKAQNNEDRKRIVLEVIKPYLRITSEVKSSKYRPRYMNRHFVGSGDKYYFNDFYHASGNEIVGLKWLRDDCRAGEVCAIMSFDVNGEKPPNAWGYDIFGINVFKDKIEPIGKNIDSNILKKDCSRHGYGTYCSNYYLIGGEFD